VYIHAIGVPEGVTLLEFEEVLPEVDQEQPGSLKNQPAKEAPLKSYLSALITALLLS
jgi:hypothetical protein